jgi:hypothetical protein
MINNIPQPEIDEATALELIRSLLHKEGSWVDWGKNCQKLHKAGYSHQQIFEDTGFQSSQQNAIVVASQVYENIANSNVETNVLEYYQGPKSDILYEFRILNQEQRVTAGQLAYEKKLDVDDAHELAKAIKEVSLLAQLPPAFTKSPGDAVAYFCWKRARQKKDLQERSRLIAKGLKFAQSQTARESLEKLLSDFSVVPSLSAPLLPIYRLELEDELPRIVPFAGTYPLSAKEIQAIAGIETQSSFGHTNSTTGMMLVAVPGWQAVLKAIDPVCYVCSSEQLPKAISGTPESVLIAIDRGVTAWDANSYFLAEIDGKVEVKWWETKPDLPLIGQLVLILRPKKILDENNLLEPWQMDD